MFMVTTNFSCLAPMCCDFRPISVGRISISWVSSVTISNRWYFLWLTLELTYMRRLATVENWKFVQILLCWIETSFFIFLFFYYYYHELITFIARGKATLESEARTSRKRGNYSRYTVIETSIKVYISHFCLGNSKEMICLCSNTITVQWVMICLSTKGLLRFNSVQLFVKYFIYPKQFIHPSLFRCSLFNSRGNNSGEIALGDWYAIRRSIPRFGLAIKNYVRLRQVPT